jgi:hypothetical protein
LRGLAEAVRVTVEAFRVLLEAMRVIIEAVRLFVEAVRLLVEAGRVLRSSANKSISIDPRLRNNLLHSRFDVDVAESAATYEPVSSTATEEGKKSAVQGNRGRASTKPPTIRLSGMAMLEEDF